MPTIQHAILGVAEGIHIVPAWSVADAAALAALAPVASDVLKIAYQQDTQALHLLVNTTPTWVEIGKASAIAANTSAIGTNTTNIGTNASNISANTAAIALKSNKLLAMATSTFSASRNLAGTDFVTGAHSVMAATNATLQTLTIPSGFSTGSMPVGESLTIESIAAGAVAVADGGGNTIRSLGSLLSVKPGGVAVLWRRTSTEYRLTGDLQ